MKLRMQRNFLPTMWEKAVMYRQWALEAIGEGRDQDAIDHWQSEFLKLIGLLETITTESHTTLHDMATFEAMDRLDAQKEAMNIAQELREALDKAVA